ncbi:MAG: hypothetical protein GQ525_13540 [Draconibacterium sp.]|nr:hypothetical protein [Draconibacterium sp.]
METEEQIENYFNHVSDKLKNQDLAGALNLLSKILELEPENKKATTEKLLLEEIIRFKNIDVFSSTNLFMDPWD